MTSQVLQYQHQDFFIREISCSNLMCGALDSEVWCWVSLKGAKRRQHFCIREMLEGMTMTYAHRSMSLRGRLLNAVIIGWIDHLLDMV